MIIKELIEHQEITEKVIRDLSEDIRKICELTIGIIKSGNKILLAENGGSAADAQHIAAEFCGRFVKERRALPAIALTTDSSVPTAIANDFGYDYVFARQLEALAHPGDLFIAISTSGNSPGVTNAVKMARGLNCRTLGLTGKDGGALKDFCDHVRR
jgi:D-sedoheptulose 7-phosphate isomerase